MTGCHSGDAILGQQLLTICLQHTSAFLVYMSQSMSSVAAVSSFVGFLVGSHSVAFVTMQSSAYGLFEQ